MAGIAIWVLLGLAPVAGRERPALAAQTWHCATWEQIDRSPGLCEMVFGITREQLRTAHRGGGHGVEESVCA